MNKWHLFCVILILLIGCQSKSHVSAQPSDWRQLNVGPFKISIPLTWKYQDPGEQEDSFVGQITGPELMLSFDCSDHGYANSLISTTDNDAKRHNIKIDTTGKYIIKTIWPKVVGKGMTGVDMHSRSSPFNFQMSGNNLSAQNQKLALKAFKTITFK